VALTNGSDWLISGPAVRPAHGTPALFP